MVNHWLETTARRVQCIPEQLLPPSNEQIEMIAVPGELRQSPCIPLAILLLSKRNSVISVNLELFICNF